MIGERLRTVRVQRALTQEDLALRIGVAERQIARYESGEVSPRTCTAVRIAVELRVSLDWLVGLAPCGECGETDGEEEITKRTGEDVRTCEHCRREGRDAA